MTLHPPDRQKDPRVKFRAPVTFFPVINSSGEDSLEIPQRDFPAQGMELSEGGIRLELKKDSPETQILRIRFSLRRFVAIIVYAQRVWKKDKQCGFQFIVLSESNRLEIRDLVERKYSKTDPLA